ncbi:MAG: MFS transporter [Rhodospirillales bacterium]|jgi:MFS family permease|nr:MFS transporter [Rhodospirillales bacterium]MBT5077123.1 MFS transporter [Rhodospirillales bacterium]MBT5113750.1 MFS transporter [Rhodospirillales bacterium]MBT5672278.1 MFS transporter [Rhodospirillales bacterium]MBT6187049.1 MFS transporter [Rhodospirillales bacterium]
MFSDNPIITGYRRAMRHRHYRNYTYGSTFSLVGTWTHRVAMGWLTWELTHSYAWLGIIAFADLFSMMLITPIAGEHADRMDRIKLATWSQFAMMCQAATVAILVFTDLIEIWSLLTLTIILGLMHGYHTASRLSMVPNLVPREDLMPALAINSMIFNVARFIGPAVAGLIIANFGISPAFAFNVLTFIGFLAVLISLEPLEIEHKSDNGKGALANIAEGVRYSVNHAGIGPLLIMLTITSFCARSLPDLLPGFADGIFQRGPEGLAWLTSMMGLGAMLSGFVFLARDGVVGMTSMVTYSLLFMALSIIAFAISDVFWVSTVIIVSVGFFMSMTTIGTLNLMQTAVSGEIRGRVMSMYTFLHQGGPAIGTLLIGGVAEHTGLPWPVSVGAGIAILVWVWMLNRLPAMQAAMETDAVKAADTPSSPPSSPSSS